MTAAVEPRPPDLGEISLGPDALDMLGAAHLSLRAAIEAACAPAPDRAAARRLTADLTGLIARHQGDEEAALFPALRAAAKAEDGLDATLDRLIVEHRGVAAAAEGAAAALARIGAAEDGSADRAAVAAFWALKRRHVAFEAAVILPLARARLSSEIREELARRIAARHGVCLLPRVAAPAHA